MLQTIQIITLLQGVFLLFFLFKNRKKYYYYNFNFLSALLVSLLFYIIGDDNNNLFLHDYDFFFVDKTLFVTLLYLFLNYFTSSKKITFTILWYFIPTVIYIVIELYEVQFSESFLTELIERFLAVIFIIYLILSILLLRKTTIAKFIKLPFYFLLFSLLLSYGLFTVEFLFEEKFLTTLNTVLLFEISVLFYYLTYVFVFNHNFFDLPILNSKYKNSSLNSNHVEDYKRSIIHAMEVNKIFTNPNLSLQLFSDTVNIPKHFISEILSSYLHTNFQDFVNEYRVEEFIKLYSNPENDHFSVLGIATSAGFKNKATFNTNFKKFKGISPTKYKQNNLQ